MNLLQRTEELFHSARVATIEAAAALYEVRETKVWETKHESWSEYVDTLGISKGQASKLLTVFEHFAIEGRLLHAKLAQVEPDRLYWASKLEGTPKEQFEKALVLSRGELREQQFFEENGEEHVCEWIEVCRLCNKRHG